MIAMVIERTVQVKPVTLTAEGERRIQKCDAECLCPWCLEPLPQPATVKNGVKAGVHTNCFEIQRKGIKDKEFSKSALIKDGKRRADKQPGPQSLRKQPAELSSK